MVEAAMITRRSNKRHDRLLTSYKANAKELARLIERRGRGREKLLAKHQLSQRGFRGPCVLRSLSRFDVGSTFLVDSLHNVYLGVFVSALGLFLIGFRA